MIVSIWMCAPARCTPCSARTARGGYNPFTGPITDNTGVVRIKDGEAWGGDKMGNFDWYAEGVVGKPK
jgi:basic membrane protein A and related proteins